MLPIGIQNVCICALSGEVLRLGPKLLVWHHFHHVLEISWTRQSRPSPLPRVKHLLGCDDQCMLSVPLSTNVLHYSRWQSGGSCQVLSTGDFTLFCHVFDSVMGILFSLFVTFVLLSCSRVCLLDVSRLLGLTLRHFAPVCSCHRDSLTRWRLAIVQEAVRVFFFLSLLDWSLLLMTCVWWCLTAYEEGLWKSCIQR